MSGFCFLFHLVQCNTSHKLGGSFRKMVQTQLTQVMKDLKPRKEQLKGVQVADVGFVWICCAVADFFRYCWRPIVVATIISRNIWNGSYHLIHPAITRVLRAFGIDKWSCKRLAWKISQKEDPNWAQIFWGATNYKLPWCNLEIVRRRQCCKAAWIQVLSAPATRPAAIGYAR